MKKIFVVMAAALLGIFIMLGILTLTNVVSLHELAETFFEMFSKDKSETTVDEEDVEITVKVQGVEKALQEIVSELDKVANNQEEMTAAVMQLTSNLDPNNENLHKELIAMLEAKGLKCYCCHCSAEDNMPETQAPVVNTCTHSSTKYSIGDGVHYTKCASCGKVLATATCKFNSNGYCYTCGGYRKPAETTAPETTQPSCNHTGTTLRATTGSTHAYVCKECNFTVKIENCIYTNNGYCICGSVCAHANTNHHANNNDTHSLICTECGTTTNTFACLLNTGACTCGNFCKHTKTNVVSNNNGTHAEKCVICNYTVKTVNCVYTNNACICGHIKVQTPVYCNLKYIAVEGRNVHGVRCINHVNEQYEEACTLINNCCTKCGGYYSAANRIPTSGSNDSEIVPGSGNNDDIVPGSGNTSSKCNLRYVAIPGRDIHLVRCPEHVNEQYTESCTYQNGCCIKCAGAKQCDDDTVPGSGSSNDIVPGSGSNDDIVPGSGSNNDIVPGSNGNNDFGGFGNPF